MVLISGWGGGGGGSECPKSFFGCQAKTGQDVTLHTSPLFPNLGIRRNQERFMAGARRSPNKLEYCLHGKTLALGFLHEVGYWAVPSPWCLPYIDTQICPCMAAGGWRRFTYASAAKPQNSAETLIPCRQRLPDE